MRESGGRFVGALLAVMALTAAAMPAAHAETAAPAECSAAVPPAGPVKGDVLGKPVDMTTGFVLVRNGITKINDGAYDAYRLEFASENEGSAELEFGISLIVRPGEKPDGKIFRAIAGKGLGEQPAAGAGAPEIQGWSIDDRTSRTELGHIEDDASIRLELGQRMGPVLPGRLWLCVPAKQTAVGGSFEAEMEN